MFALSIVVCSDRLEAVKAELTRTLSGVKSSHRCEALARGLGYRTYASALAAIETGAESFVSVQGDPFVAYLENRCFAVSSKPFYAAAAKVALRDVAERNPHLTMWGLGVGRPRRKFDGLWESSGDLNAKFVREREELTSDAAIAPFLASLAFLARVTPTKSIRDGTNSYKLKHVAEQYSCTYPEGEKLGPIYVPNGAFIAAALHAGFRVKSYVDELGYFAPNVSFNMSKVDLENLECEIWPNGERARDRRRKSELGRLWGAHSKFDVVPNVTRLGS